MFHVIHLLLLRLPLLGERHQTEETNAAKPMLTNFRVFMEMLLTVDCHLDASDKHCHLDSSDRNGQNKTTWTRLCPYSVRMNVTRSCFSCSVSFVSRIRLKNSTVSSNVSNRPSCK